MERHWNKLVLLTCIVLLILRQLEEHIIRLREELDREREERNYFQLERDKIHTFWEITKRQLDEKKADLRNRDREMEEAEESHQTEIRVTVFMMNVSATQKVT